MRTPILAALLLTGCAQGIAPIKAPPPARSVYDGYDADLADRLVTERIVHCDDSSAVALTACVGQARLDAMRAAGASPEVQAAMASVTAKRNELAPLIDSGEMSRETAEAIAMVELTSRMAELDRMDSEAIQTQHLIYEMQESRRATRDAAVARAFSDFSRNMSQPVYTPPAPVITPRFPTSTTTNCGVYSGILNCRSTTY